MSKTTCVGLGNCLDLYEKLKFESKRLQSNWHYYDFWNFAVTAWHLHYDWLDKDSHQRPVYSTRKKNHIPPNMCLVLNAVCDVANGSKHFYLRGKTEAKRVVGETHPPEIRDFQEWLYDEPISGITIESCYINLRELDLIIMGYFEWVFDDAISIDSFPRNINELLNYVFSFPQNS